MREEFQLFCYTTKRGNSSFPWICWVFRCLVGVSVVLHLLVQSEDLFFHPIETEILPLFSFSCNYTFFFNTCSSSRLVPCHERITWESLEEEVSGRQENRCRGCEGCIERDMKRMKEGKKVEDLYGRKKMEGQTSLFFPWFVWGLSSFKRSLDSFSSTFLFLFMLLFFFSSIPVT